MNAPRVVLGAFPVVERLLHWILEALGGGDVPESTMLTLYSEELRCDHKWAARLFICQISLTQRPSQALSVKPQPADHRKRLRAVTPNC